MSIEWTDDEREAAYAEAEQACLDVAGDDISLDIARRAAQAVMHTLAPFVEAHVRQARAEAAERERDEALAKVAAVEKVVWHLKSAHIRVAIQTNIPDDYERGQQHAQDDAYRRLREALAAREVEV